MKLSIAENISKLRKEHSMTQEQLAEALGVTFASVSKWERGVAKPELDLIVEMAEMFEVSVDSLIGYNLNSDGMENLISQMENAVDSRDEETAATLCERILRNYPNNDRAADACANSYYRLYIYTRNKIYMEQCIEQTKRLMILKQGESERARLERIQALGNQYELLQQWDKAKEYYEQSNVSGSNEVFIAGCLLQQEETQKAIVKLSDALVESVFNQYCAVNKLADGWIAAGQDEKACAALEWMYSVMESLNYNPTTMIVLLVRLAGLYDDCDRTDMVESSLRKAVALATETDNQEINPTADFLEIEEGRKILVAAPGSRELLMNIAASLEGSSMGDILKEALQ